MDVLSRYRTIAARFLAACSICRVAAVHLGQYEAAPLSAGWAFAVGFVIGFQHGIHASEIASSLPPEPIQHFGVNAQVNGLLALRNDQTGFRPVNVGNIRIRIAGNSPIEIFIGHRIDARPIRMIFPDLTQFSFCNSLAHHVSLLWLK